MNILSHDYKMPSYFNMNSEGKERGKNRRKEKQEWEREGNTEMGGNKRRNNGESVDSLITSALSLSLSVCTYVCGDRRSTSDIIPKISFALWFFFFLRQSRFMTIWIDWLGRDPRGSCVFASPALELQTHNTLPCFLHGWWRAGVL